MNNKKNLIENKTENKETNKKRKVFWNCGKCPYVTENVRLKHLDDKKKQNKGGNDMQTQQQ